MTRAPELRVRPMEQADIPAAVSVSAAAFDFELTDRDAAERWVERLQHPLATDPDGAFVAERDGAVLGVAEAIRRERLWCLSLLAVRPGMQGAGAGRALLERAMSYRDRTDCGLIVSSNDHRALRLYARAGFSLHPTFEAVGPIDRRAVPRPHPEVCERGSEDLGALEAISREVRGAPHTPELELALRSGAHLLRLGDRGFALAQPGVGVWVLVARDEQAAVALLWSSLELAGESQRAGVRWITGDQDWAIQVVVRAGLRLSAHGALCVRGRPGPLRPFVPSGAFA
ncbi:MAG TPA: GNAT family N-acetyltransferase [Solirubrobacteraceae bacterium]